MALSENGLRQGFRLGDWRVEPSRNRVADPQGDDARLEPKVMEVLVCLATHAGDVVSRRQLEDAVWGAAIVSDQALTNAISELRRVFGDSRFEPRFIETVTKRGYRMIQPVEALPAPAFQATAASKHQRAEGATGQGQHPRARESLTIMAVTGAIVAALLGGIYLWASQHPLQPVPVQPLTSFVGVEWTGSWSPDGSQVAIVQTDNGSADISVMSLGGGDRRLVAGGPYDELTPRWSPDGSKIAYLSDRGRGLEVFWTPPTGGPKRRIASTGIPFLERWMGIYALSAMPWSPDGEELVFSRREPAVPDGHPTVKASVSWRRANRAGPYGCST